MSDLLFNAIRELVYKQAVACGPHKADNQYVPFTQDLSDIGTSYIVPDLVMRPKIFVTIDFTSTYVVSGERLVSVETLDNVYKTLLDFYYYYFEYELSYNKSWYLGKDQIKDSGFSSKDVNEFINYIVNFFLTSITVQRSINNIGTASFTLKDNWNIKGSEKIRLFFNKAVSVLNQLFVPMLPIMFWAQGRIYKDWVFPLFDGYITSVSDSNSEGFISSTINCRDALELARVSYEMLNPAIIQLKEQQTQEDINIFNKPFFGLDHFKIVQTMFVGGSLSWDAETKQRKLIVGQKLAGQQSFEGLGPYTLASDFYDNDIKVADLTYAIGPTDVAEDRAIKKDNFSLAIGLEKTKHVPNSADIVSTGGRLRKIVTWGTQITPYREFQFSAIEVFQSQFDSRLSVLQETAKLVYYQLYVDPWGNIQYHPYRLATKFLNTDISYAKDGKKIVHENIFPGAQILGPEETLASNSVYNIEELITFLRLLGIDPTTKIQPELGNIIGECRALFLQKRFGYRRAEVSCPLFNNNFNIIDGSGASIKFMDKAARELLIFKNAELYSRTDTIIFRPELELAMPICIMPDKEIFYVQSITHTVDIGGSARTEISSNFGRSYLAPAPDIHSIMETADCIYKGIKDPPTVNMETFRDSGMYVDQINTLHDAAEELTIKLYDKVKQTFNFTADK